MKKINVLIAAILLLTSLSVSAQVAITTDGSSANGAAMLDVQSTTKGFLPPRMTIAQRNAISSPVAGLVIYNTEEKTLNIYTGASWGLINPVVCGNSFTDSRDNQVYTTVQIGGQCWMSKNLSYLPSVVGPSTGSRTSPYYYVYGYNGTDVATAKATTNYQTYGVLYNWTSSLTACPTGWHLPTDAELTTMTTLLGGLTVAGGSLKEAGTIHWLSPNFGATNESGFTALPAGYLTASGVFEEIFRFGFWWNSTESSSNSGYWSMNSMDGWVVSSYLDKIHGFSVRCIKD